MHYDKPAIPISDQIRLLESRGLSILDKELAIHFLKNVSYYRLAGYWWPLQEDKTEHTFKKGSQFETVIQLYNFDRELRLIVFNMIERIEIAIRTYLIYDFSNHYDPWWFEDVTLFKNHTYWKKHLQSIKKDISRSKEVFIAEHKKKYHQDDRCPPAWKTLEVVSLGILSKLYANLRNNLPEKKGMAEKLGAGNHTYLSSWLQSISVVRNICAHHSRLWNRNLPTPPKLLTKAPLPWIKAIGVDRHSFYPIASIMLYLLQTISPDNHFIQRIENLLAKYPTIDTKAMGFPEAWQEEDLWSCR